MTAAVLKVRISKEIEVEGLGAKIQKLRKSDPRPVDELAKAAGISRGYWYDIEGENIRQSLPLETLRKIEEVLDADFGVEG